MPVKFNFQNPMLRTWMLLHQTYNSVSKCEDKRFVTAGLTTQQHAILMAIKYAYAPATPTLIADWVDRHLNSITSILNRMEKNGLVKRVRNPQDHRSFCLVITKNGEKSLKDSTSTGWSLIQELLGSCSEEDIRTLANLLEKLRSRAVERYYDNKNFKEVDISGKM